MPRALLLCEFPALNGGERSLLAVLPTLQQAGWEFDMWCPGTGALAEAFAAIGVRVIVQRPVAPSPTSLEDRRADLAAVIAAGPPYDLIHANSLAMGRLSGPVVEAAGVPSISHLRDIVGLNRTAITDLNRHTRLLAVSQAARAHHVAQGLSAEKAEVLYNGIDLEAFRPSPPTGYLQRELGIDPSSRLAAMVGQFIVRKGQAIGLAAMLQAMKQRRDVHLLIVGSRHSEKPETIELERELYLNVSDHTFGGVHFVGTRFDVARLLPECRLLVHTPRQEPLGRVLLEAAACGVPVVATDVGGTREIFPREESDGATLVPVDDAAATTEAIVNILDDDERAAAMSIAGRNRIAAAFSVEQSAAGLLQHYAEVSGR